jgi:hypothetical protein
MSSIAGECDVAVLAAAIPIAVFVNGGPPSRKSPMSFDLLGAVLAFAGRRVVPNSRPAAGVGVYENLVGRL